MQAPTHSFNLLFRGFLTVWPMLWVAALFGALLSVTTPAGAATEARALEIVNGQCFICHGVEGEGSSPVFPRLAGQNAEYVARQLRDYKSGRRQSSTMQVLVRELSEADMLALGQYFASRPVYLHHVSDVALAEMGAVLFHQGRQRGDVPACASCHGAQARGSAGLPRLAGQHAQYTERQLKLFNKRERTNDNAVMQDVAVKLSETEIKALAMYLSGLK